MVMPHEQYTMTLSHEYVDSDGKVVQLDLPVKVKYLIAPEVVECVPRSVLVNEMLERMGRYILDNVNCKEG